MQFGINAVEGSSSVTSTLAARVTLLVGLFGTSLKADVQTIPLSQGRNFISISLNPTNPAPSAVFGSLGNNFVEAYSFDNQTKKWSVFRNPTRTDASSLNALAPLAMPQVTLGRGYIVLMAASGNLVVNGTPPPSPSVTIYPGMNLTGFPITSAQEGAGLQDLLNSPQFSFKTAFSWYSGNYASFTDNGILDDTVFRYSAGQALWIHSNEVSNVVWTPNAILAKPIVFFEQGDPIIIETPMAGEAVGTASQQLNIRVSRPYTGPLKFMVTGTAHPGTDFSVLTVTATERIGSIIGNQVANAMVPLTVSFPQKARIQNNASVFVTLRRPVETPAVTDSASLPQVAVFKLTDGRNGIYEGFIQGDSTTTKLNGQNVRVALRSNGRAIVDPADGGMISSRFVLPYTLANGVPQFSAPAQPITLPSTAALGRDVRLTITPGTTVSLGTGSAGVPAFDVPLTLRFDGLIAGAPFTNTAKLTLTQADPAL